jgi:Integrase core domain
VYPTTGLSSPAWRSSAGGKIAASIGTPSHPRNHQQNAFAECFIGRLRDQCLNETLLSSFAHAREALIEWKADYNTVRPHSSLRNLPPATFAKGQRSRDPTGRIAVQRPLHHRASTAQNAIGTLPMAKEGSHLSANIAAQIMARIVSCQLVRTAKIGKQQFGLPANFIFLQGPMPFVQRGQVDRHHDWVGADCSHELGEQAGAVKLRSTLNHIVEPHRLEPFRQRIAQGYVQ